MSDEGELKKQLKQTFIEEVGTTDKGYLATVLKPIDDALEEFPKLIMEIEALDFNQANYVDFAVEVGKWKSKWLVGSK